MDNEVSAELNEPHSEEEDKFSDFDPAALPEQDPELSQNSKPVESNANSDDNKENFSIVKGSDHPPTDDYMSDVSSGEDFLSATHDQSGPEDGEVSEAEETFVTKPSEINSDCDPATDTKNNT